MTTATTETSEESVPMKKQKIEKTETSREMHFVLWSKNASFSRDDIKLNNFQVLNVGSYVDGNYMYVLGIVKCDETMGTQMIDLFQSFSEQIGSCYENVFLQLIKEEKNSKTEVDNFYNQHLKKENK
jgi:hypothetical protein